MDTKLGSNRKGLIEVGEPADLLFWSLNENAFTPVPYGNFDSALIYNAPDIKPYRIMIDGNIILDKYQFTIVSEKDIFEMVNLRSKKMVSKVDTKWALKF